MFFLVPEVIFIRVYCDISRFYSSLLFSNLACVSLIVATSDLRTMQSQHMQTREWLLFNYMEMVVLYIFCNLADQCFWISIDRPQNRVSASPRRMILFYCGDKLVIGC